MNFDGRVLKSKIATSRIQPVKYNLDGLAKFENAGGSKIVILFLLLTYII